MPKKMKSSEETKTAPFGLRGVGKQIAKHLARLKIYSVEDLLFHLPYRYQDRTQIQAIRQLIPGQEAVIQATIKSISYPARGKTKLLCELSDGTGSLHLRFFHVPAYQTDLFKAGTVIRCYSEMRVGPKGFEMVHPEFKVITQDKEASLDTYLTPTYPATEGLSQYMLRKLMREALLWLERTPTFQELMPQSLLQHFSLPTLKEALTFVHQPPRETSITSLLENKTHAQKRIILEELLAHRLSLLHIKNHFQTKSSVHLRQGNKLSSQFLQQLPFKLTRAQTNVMKEISEDLEKSYPMLRLVQGDVGSGKTVVAALSLLQAIENGYQAAMMAPTELLAEQHYRVFKKWFEPLGVQVAFLSSNVKASARSAALTAIAKGDAQLVLGTHALFQKDVNFLNLALVVIDEQHRFGVHQRALFREKGRRDSFFPHQLFMTATPIPRTLAMSFYADLDCSIIDELPPNRTPIATSVIANSRREEIMLRIKEACKEGRQVYWVCPLIDESETQIYQAAIQTAQQLQQFLTEVKVGLVHGKMASKEKEAVMQAFQQGEVHLLVATTVIEVGVDVPNASLMIIENAERLGLSQLHQLRGRVGRGRVASHCVLLYQHPLSELARTRLTVMRETTDGFKIAHRDLELRGPGEILGTRQTGELAFRVADLLRDSEILPTVQKAAEFMQKEHHDKIEPLIKRWLGENWEYGEV